MYKARAIWLSLLVCGPAAAQQTQFAPEFGRYMPLYPGMYFGGAYAQDDRDSTYDQNGVERDSAAPQSGQSSFPETSYQAQFLWHFPVFESYNIPFLSSRTHFARAVLNYKKTRTEGALADFVNNTADDARTDADDLQNNGSGLGDPMAEFGSYLYGSPASGWRARQSTPLAILALVGVTFPGGEYEQDAPINAGSNTVSIHYKLAAHAQPLTGLFVDGGIGLREYYENYNAAFGALDPTSQGDDLFWDVSVTYRLPGGIYLGAFADGRKGDPNLYEDPRFAPNAPPPPNTTPPSDNYPRPGNYRDQGTELKEYGASLQYFVTQRWRAAVHYAQPQSGRSGQFLLPFTNRQPAGCTVGSTGCTESAGATVQVDGMGPARSYSSDRLMFSVTYNFGLGDAFTCTGCEQ